MSLEHLHQPVGVQLKNLFLGQEGLVGESSSQGVPLPPVRLRWGHADASLAILGRDNCEPRRVFLEVQTVLLKYRDVNRALLLNVALNSYAESIPVHHKYPPKHPPR